MAPTLRSAFRRKLLRWYEKNKRDLPWRRTRDPYAIWISETMLQQTRVSVVIPYYERFLSELPTIDALARARRSRVLRLWSGLGYYRRAENLHRAARQMALRHGGMMPRQFAQLRALPGIGDYTAGAISSIAFGKPYPAIDGNVRRVIGRLTGFDGESRIKTAAAELASFRRAGEFNQALMELGATLCTATQRRCGECAARSICASAQSTTAPLPRRRLRFTSVVWPLAIVRQGKKILLHRRDEGGLLGSLWELPGGEMKSRAPIAAFLRRQLRAVGGSLAQPRKLGAVRHAITHRRILAPVYLFDVAGPIPLALPKARWRWTDLSKLRGQATSSMTAKACGLLPDREKAVY
jgi:A/G-specific adenine glycosylase